MPESATYKDRNPRSSRFTFDQHTARDSAATPKHATHPDTDTRSSRYTTRDGTAQRTQRPVPNDQAKDDNPGLQRRSSVTEAAQERQHRVEFQSNLPTLRKKAFNLYYAAYFQAFMIAAVVFNCIWMLIDHPSVNRQEMSSARADAFFAIYLIFALIFTFEMVVYMVGHGLFTPKFGYFRGVAHCIEFIVVIVCWVDVCMDLNSWSYLPIIRAVRGVRLFYSLRHIKALRMVGRSLQTTLVQILPIALLVLFVIVVWGSNWVYYYGRWYHYKCLPDEDGAAILRDPTHALYNYLQLTYAVEQKRRCATTHGVFAGQHFCPQYFYCGYDRASILPLENFDNFLLSAYNVHRIINMETWVDIMYNMHDISGWPADVIICLLVLLANFILLQFFMAVVIGEFENAVSEFYRQRARREAYGMVEFHALLQSMKADPDLVGDRVDENGAKHPQAATGNDLMQFVLSNGHAESKKGARELLSKMMRCNVLKRVGHGKKSKAKSMWSRVDDIDPSELKFEAGKLALYQLHGDGDEVDELVMAWRKDIGLNNFVQYAGGRAVFELDAEAAGLSVRDVSGGASARPTSTRAQEDGIGVGEHVSAHAYGGSGYTPHPGLGTVPADMSMIVPSPHGQPRLFFAPSDRHPHSHPQSPMYVSYALTPTHASPMAAGEDVRPALVDVYGNPLSLQGAFLHPYHQLMLAGGYGVPTMHPPGVLPYGTSGDAAAHVAPAPVTPRSPEAGAQPLARGGAGHALVDVDSIVDDDQSTVPRIASAGAVISLKAFHGHAALESPGRRGSSAPVPPLHFDSSQAAVGSPRLNTSKTSVIDLDTIPYFSREEVEASMNVSVDHVVKRTPRQEESSVRPGSGRTSNVSPTKVDALQPLLDEDTENARRVSATDVAAVRSASTIVAGELDVSHTASSAEQAVVTNAALSTPELPQRRVSLPTSGRETSLSDTQRPAVPGAHHSLPPPTDPSTPLLVATRSVPGPVEGSLSPILPAAERPAHTSSPLQRPFSVTDSERTQSPTISVPSSSPVVGSSPMASATRALLGDARPNSLHADSSLPPSAARAPSDSALVLVDVEGEDAPVVSTTASPPEVFAALPPAPRAASAHSARADADQRALSDSDASGSLALHSPPPGLSFFRSSSSATTHTFVSTLSDASAAMSDLNVSTPTTGVPGSLFSVPLLPLVHTLVPGTPHADVVGSTLELQMQMQHAAGSPLAALTTSRLNGDSTRDASPAFSAVDLYDGASESSDPRAHEHASTMVARAPSPLRLLESALVCHRSAAEDAQPAPEAVHTRYELCEPQEVEHHEQAKLASAEANEEASPLDFTAVSSTDSSVIMLQSPEPARARTRDMAGAAVAAPVPMGFLSPDRAANVAPADAVALSTLDASLVTSPRRTAGSMLADDDNDDEYEYEDAGGNTSLLASLPAPTVPVTSAAAVAFNDSYADSSPASPERYPVRPLAPFSPLSPVMQRAGQSTQPALTAPLADTPIDARGSAVSRSASPVSHLRYAPDATAGDSDDDEAEFSLDYLPLQQGPYPPGPPVPGPPERTMTKRQLNISSPSSGRQTRGVRQAPKEAILTAMAMNPDFMKLRKQQSSRKLMGAGADGFASPSHMGMTAGSPRLFQTASSPSYNRLPNYPSAISSPANSARPHGFPRGSYSPGALASPQDPYTPALSPASYPSAAGSYGPSGAYVLSPVSGMGAPLVYLPGHTPTPSMGPTTPLLIPPSPSGRAHFTPFFRNPSSAALSAATPTSAAEFPPAPTPMSLAPPMHTLSPVAERAGTPLPVARSHPSRPAESPSRNSPNHLLFPPPRTDARADPDGRQPEGVVARGTVTPLDPAVAGMGSAVGTGMGVGNTSSPFLLARMPSTTRLPSVTRALSLTPAPALASRIPALSSLTVNAPDPLSLPSSSSGTLSSSSSGPADKSPVRVGSPAALLTPPPFQGRMDLSVDVLSHTSDGSPMDRASPSPYAADPAESDGAALLTGSIPATSSAGDADDADASDSRERGSTRSALKPAEPHRGSINSLAAQRPVVRFAPMDNVLETPVDVVDAEPAHRRMPLPIRAASASPSLVGIATNLGADSPRPNFLLRRQLSRSPEQPPLPGADAADATAAESVVPVPLVVAPPATLLTHLPTSAELSESDECSTPAAHSLTRPLIHAASSVPPHLGSSSPRSHQQHHRPTLFHARADPVAANAGMPLLMPRPSIRPALSVPAAPPTVVSTDVLTVAGDREEGAVVCADGNIEEARAAAPDNLFMRAPPPPQIVVAGSGFDFASPHGAHAPSPADMYYNQYHPFYAQQPYAPMPDHYPPFPAYPSSSPALSEVPSSGRSVRHDNSLYAHVGGAGEWQSTCCIHPLTPCFRIVSHFMFEMVMSCVTLLYIVCVATFHHGQSQTVTLALTVVMNICLVAFVLEFLIRVLGLPCRSRTMKVESLTRVLNIDLSPLFAGDEDDHDHAYDDTSDFFDSDVGVDSAHAIADHPLSPSQPARQAEPAEEDEFSSVLMVSVGDRLSGSPFAHINTRFVVPDEAHLGFDIKPYWGTLICWIDIIFLSLAIFETFYSAATGQWPVNPLEADVMLPHGNFTVATILCYFRLLIFIRLLPLLMLTPLKPLLEVIIKAAPNVLLIMLLIVLVVVYFAVLGMLWVGSNHVDNSIVITYNNLGWSLFTSLFLIFPDNWAEWASDFALDSTTAIAVLTVPMYYIAPITLNPFILVMVLEDLSNMHKRVDESYVLIMREQYEDPESNASSDTLFVEPQYNQQAQMRKEYFHKLLSLPPGQLAKQAHASGGADDAAHGSDAAHRSSKRTGGHSAIEMSHMSAPTSSDSHSSRLRIAGSPLPPPPMLPDAPMPRPSRQRTVDPSVAASPPGHPALVPRTSLAHPDHALALPDSMPSADSGTVLLDAPLPHSDSAAADEWASLASLPHTSSSSPAFSFAQQPMRIHIERASRSGSPAFPPLTEAPELVLDLDAPFVPGGVLSPIPGSPVSPSSPTASRAHGQGHGHDSYPSSPRYSLNLPDDNSRYSISGLPSLPRATVFSSLSDFADEDDASERDSALLARVAMHPVDSARASSHSPSHAAPDAYASLLLPVPTPPASPTHPVSPSASSAPLLTVPSHSPTAMQHAPLSPMPVSSSNVAPTHPAVAPLSTQPVSAGASAQRPPSPTTSRGSLLAGSSFGGTARRPSSVYESAPYSFSRANSVASSRKWAQKHAPPRAPTQTARTREEEPEVEAVPAYEPADKSDYGVADVDDGANLCCCLGVKARRLRKLTKKALTSRAFSWTVTLFVILDFVSMAIEGPSRRPPAIKDLFFPNWYIVSDNWVGDGEVFAAIEFISNLIFVLKTCLLYVAFGPKRFFTGKWILFEFINAVGTTLGLFPFSPEINRFLGMFRSIRMVQVLIVHSSTAVILSTLFRSLPSVLPMFALMIMFACVFAIIGVYLWAGQLWKCNDSDVFGRLECVGQFINEDYVVPGALLASAAVPEPDDTMGIEEDRRWTSWPYSFDTVVRGVITLMQIISFDGWIDLALHTFRIQGVDRQPIPDDSAVNNMQAFYVFFFAVFFIIGNIFFVQLSIAAVYLNFERVKAESDGTASLSEAQLTWNNARNAIQGIQPLMKFKIPPYQQWMPYWLFTLRVQLHLLIDTTFHRVLMLTALVLSVFYCVTLHYDESPAFMEARMTIAFFAMAIYILEAVAKCIGLSPWQYWRLKWHRFETLFAVIFLTLLALTPALSYQVMEPWILFFLSLSLIRIVQVSVALSRFAYQLYVAFPSIAAVTSVTMVLMMCFAMVFMRLFGFVAYKDPSLLFDYTIYERTNFSSFFDSFLVILRIATAERYAEVMYGVARAPQCDDFGESMEAHYHYLYDVMTGVTNSAYSPCPQSTTAAVSAYVLFPLCFFFMYLLIIPLFSAVVLQSFHELSDICDGDITVDTLNDFTAIWALLDSQGDEYISIPQLVVLLRALDKPLSCGIGRDRTEMFFREKEQAKQAAVALRREAREDIMHMAEKKNDIEEEMVATAAAGMSFEQEEEEQELERLIEKHYSRQPDVEALRMLNPYAYRYDSAREREMGLKAKERQRALSARQVSVASDITNASDNPVGGRGGRFAGRRAKGRGNAAVAKLMSNLVNPSFKPGEIAAILSCLDLPVQHSAASRQMIAPLTEVTTNDLFKIKTRDMTIGTLYGVVSFKTVLYALIRRITGVSIDDKLPIQHEYVAEMANHVNSQEVPFIERYPGTGPSPYYQEKHSFGHLHDNIQPLLTQKHYSAYEVLMAVRIQRAYLRRKALKLVRQRARLPNNNLTRKLGLNEPFLAELVNVKARLARAEILSRATFPTNSDTLAMRLVHMIERMTLCRKKIIKKLEEQEERKTTINRRNRYGRGSALSRDNSPQPSLSPGASVGGDSAADSNDNFLRTSANTLMLPLGALPPSPTAPLIPTPLDTNNNNNSVITTAEEPSPMQEDIPLPNAVPEHTDQLVVADASALVSTHPASPRRSGDLSARAAASPRVLSPRLDRVASVASVASLASAASIEAEPVVELSEDEGDAAVVKYEDDEFIVSARVRMPSHASSAESSLTQPVAAEPPDWLATLERAESIHQQASARAPLSTALAVDAVNPYGVCDEAVDVDLSGDVRAVREVSEDEYDSAISPTTGRSHASVARIASASLAAEDFGVDTFPMVTSPRTAVPVTEDVEDVVDATEGTMDMSFNPAPLSARHRDSLPRGVVVPPLPLHNADVRANVAAFSASARASDRGEQRVSARTSARDVFARSASQQSLHASARASARASGTVLPLHAQGSVSSTGALSARRSGTFAGPLSARRRSGSSLISDADLVALGVEVTTPYREAKVALGYASDGDDDDDDSDDDYEKQGDAVDNPVLLPADAMVSMEDGLPAQVELTDLAHVDTIPALTEIVVAATHAPADAGQGGVAVGSPCGPPKDMLPASAGAPIVTTLAVSAPAEEEVAEMRPDVNGDADVAVAAEPSEDLATYTVQDAASRNVASSPVMSPVVSPSVDIVDVPPVTSNDEGSEDEELVFVPPEPSVTIAPPPEDTGAAYAEEEEEDEEMFQFKYSW